MLLVDDGPHTRDILAGILGREGYRCTIARDIAAARAALEDGPYDLTVCAVRLPDGSGLDLLADAARRDDAMAVLMISGLDDAALAERAIELGAYGYVVTPFSTDDVLIGVFEALRQRRAELDARGEIRAAQEHAIQRLCVATRARQPGAVPHINQVSGYCWHIGRQLGLGRHECELMRMASPMHDVGTVVVPERVLRKPAPLTAAERAQMERHAETGYRILAGSRAPLLRVASAIAWTHHERFDGSGYPRGLKRDEIPLVGRIAAVADVFVALTRDRVYRPRLTRAHALAVMETGRGRDFDSDVLDAFLAVEERLTAEMAGPEVGLPSVMGETASDGLAEATLSPREREVLQLAAHGRSSDEIAEALVISPSTVKTHFQHIYAKLEARDRAAAVARAMRTGLIE